ncbi:MAG: hypothetical protein KME56_13870 [Candidatus Thiodiazotropha sp. (ex Ctena orbiculata)]|nr:hypothetical protein [Candidatus Thiodiazotropha taylori]MBT2997693.1 hypothetical protein [Candidatus Thiodiazotropha taylori]MBT3001886.1 hypothetical protein [Candidatus Thiodiazotropha taylori]MBV2107728.1 hypothetical protein [Candidatus Thiodiazotropha taylori]MBV2111381.1 hypothetical protein [Candidatus Thiodiazotropha taylori]
MIKIPAINILILSIFFASCGGGTGSGSTTPTTNNEDSNTSNPVVDTPSGDQTNHDIPSVEVDPGEGIDQKHILGPDYGEELFIYHATLVMDVLRLIGFYKGYFVGIDVGETYPIVEFPDKDDDIGYQALNGTVYSCMYRNDEPRGSKTVTWNNGGTEHPKQYTSTRIYNNCDQNSLHYGTFRIYDGTVLQSGTAMYVNNYPAIQSGVIHADQLKITDQQEEVSLTIDGYMYFDANTNGQRSTDISEIAMRFHEDNNSVESAGRYIEDITVHGGTITFDITTPEGQNGSSNIYGVKNATLRIDVENNNHKHIALLVETIPPPNNEVLYSLEISRAELTTTDPAPMQHTIRIDRLNPPYSSYSVYNVYIDFNKNGIIEKVNTYPNEYYEEVTLLGNRWGYISGL